MKFEILTLFPNLFDSFKEESLIGKGIEAGKLEITTWNIRDFSTDKHQQVDDAPYGGGPGMVLKIEPLCRTLDAVRKITNGNALVIMLSPQGESLTHKKVLALAEVEHIVLICGRYEAVDERVMAFVDQELSIGDYVLQGGELPAMVVIEAVSRFIPGLLGDKRSGEEDSFYQGILDCPHYTRPAVFQGKSVPAVLRSGDHQKIARWRREQALLQTQRKRPDLLENTMLSEEGFPYVSVAQKPKK